MRNAGPLLLSIFWSARTLSAEAQTSLDQSGFEKFASAIEVFPADAFFFDRTVDCGVPCQGALAFQEEIKTRPPEPALLVNLLKHTSPNVRTLAMAALLDREEIRHVPVIAALAKDSAVTFRAIVPASYIHRPQSLPTRVQTVGEIARLFASFDTEPLWLRDRPVESPAAWRIFRLKRAKQQTSPIRPARIPKIQAVRREVETLPQPERAWTLLLLRGVMGNDQADTFIRSDELVAELKSVGHEHLLELLRKGRISDDPALQPQPRNSHLYHTMCLFVLRHARDLLRPDEATFLLEREQGERQAGLGDPLITAWWAIAASDLDRRNASAILKAARARFTARFYQEDCALLAQALWRVSGRSEMRQVVNWFYEAEGVQNGRNAMWRELSIAPQPGDVELIRAVIADRRLNRLREHELEGLVKAANQFTKTPVVPGPLRDTRRRLRAAFPPG